MADMIKIFFKEDWVPAFVDRPVFLLAPLVAMSTTLLVFVVIPVAPGWGVAPDLNVGVLLFLALAGLGGVWRDAGGLVEQQQVCPARRPALGGADAFL